MKSIVDQIKEVLKNKEDKIEDACRILLNAAIDSQVSKDIDFDKIEDEFLSLEYTKKSYGEDLLFNKNILHGIFNNDNRLQTKELLTYIDEL